MQQILISSAIQLRPAQDFLEKLKANEEDSANPLPEVTGVSGDNASIQLIPPVYTGTVPENGLFIATSMDLKEIDPFLNQMALGGDAAANTSAKIGDYEFVVNPSVLETQTEAQQAGRN